MGALRKQYPGLRFSWKTVHGSKGLEADYAVVLGLRAGKYGFPAEITDDPLLDLVLAAPEAHPNAEERRLLYVAVTRARRQVFLLADGRTPSAFATELVEGRDTTSPCSVGSQKTTCHVRDAPRGGWCAWKTPKIEAPFTAA